MFRPVRQHRYEVLRGELFTASEARKLSKFAMKLPYIKAIRQKRREQVNNAFTWAYARGLKRADAIKRLKATVKQFYQSQGLKDAYAWARKERDKALARGDYIPPAPKKRRPRLSKGNVSAQKLRYREKQAAKKPYEVYDKQRQVIGHVVWSPTEQRFIRVD